MTLRTLLLASSVVAMTAGTFAYAQTVQDTVPSAESQSVTDAEIENLEEVQAKEERRGGKRGGHDCDKDRSDARDDDADEDDDSTDA